MFLNIELYKNYRFLRYKEFDTLGFMLKNRINHRLYFIWLLKFIAASISYRLIGKGYFLLK